MNGIAVLPNFEIRSVAATCRNERKRSCQRDNKQPKYQRRSRTFLLSPGSNCRSPQEINAPTGPSRFPFFLVRTNFVVTDGISKNVRYLSRQGCSEVFHLIMLRSVDEPFGGKTALWRDFKRASKGERKMGELEAEKKEETRKDQGRNRYLRLLSFL